MVLPSQVWAAGELIHRCSGVTAASPEFDLEHPGKSIFRFDARAKQLVLPTSLEEETSEFREGVVKRAGVVCCSRTGPLPVREHYALELVIAAVLTTQCRNGRSVLVFRELVAMASERGSWARLSLEEIERLVRPLGFSKRRSQNVWRATRVSRACARACATSGVDALIRTFAGVGEKCGKSFRLFW